MSLLSRPIRGEFRHVIEAQDVSWGPSELLLPVIGAETQ